MEKTSAIEKIGNWRRILPQILATSAKNLIIFNLGEFGAFPSIVIPALIGVCTDLNPDETVSVTAVQTSWLSSFAHIAHPIGSLLSGPVCDKFGRRNTILMVTIPLTISWLMLGFAQSFPVICICFASIGFCMGLKESPSITYVSEISEASMRGMMSTIALLSYNLGILIVLGCGLVLPWRKVAFICALFPLSCLVAVLFVPESPSWLLLRDRTKDAEKSLQWLRGWTSVETINKEFTELQAYSNASNSCLACSKQSIKCDHPKPTFCDKLNELKRKRTLKPMFLVFCLYFVLEFCIVTVWQPYIIQVLKAFGTPINANVAAVISAGFGIFACLFLISTVKKLGRRRLYLTSSFIVTICTFGLMHTMSVVCSAVLCTLLFATKTLIDNNEGIYGFILFPPGWISFNQQRSIDSIDKYEFIRSVVGNYSYVALGLYLTMQFITKIGVFGLPHMFSSEVFPLKSRSFLCGIATANQYVLASISVKTYYNIETWLTLPGATLFYGVISLIGFIVMYAILPETEQRSLADIESHYSDNTKGITDTYISKNSK